MLVWIRMMLIGSCIWVVPQICRTVWLYQWYVHWCWILGFQNLTPFPLSSLWLKYKLSAATPAPCLSVCCHHDDDGRQPSRTDSLSMFLLIAAWSGSLFTAIKSNYETHSFSNIHFLSHSHSYSYRPWACSFTQFSHPCIQPFISDTLCWLLFLWLC